MTATVPPVTPVDKPRRVKRGSVIGNTGLYVSIGVAALLFLVPFYLIARNALSTDPEIAGENWKFFPRSPSGATSPSCSTTRRSTSAAPC